MRNFRDRIAGFMYGRYGADQLYYALFAVSIILLIVNAFAPSIIFASLSWIILLWMIFRVFSRNVYKRRIENDKFMKGWNFVKAKFSLTFRRVRDIKTHRYRKCSHCKATLRLPRKTGRHTVQCPRCHDEFEVKIRL